MSQLNTYELCQKHNLEDKCCFVMASMKIGHILMKKHISFSLDT